MGNSNSRIPPHLSSPIYLDLAALINLAPDQRAWVLAAFRSDPLIMGDSNSRVPPRPSPPTYIDLSTLINLAPNERAWFLDALESDPLKRAKAILQNPSFGHPGNLLSLDELYLAVDDAYDELRSERIVDEGYIITLLEAIVFGVRKEGHQVSRAMGEVIKLAAGMVKGEACDQCSEPGYTAPTGDSTSLADHFVDAIEELDGLATDKGERLWLGNKTKFSIVKLCSIDNEYDRILHLSEGLRDTDDLEEMWCHKGSRCSAGCWDAGGGDEHLDWCRSREDSLFYWDD